LQTYLRHLTIEYSMLTLFTEYPSGYSTCKTLFAVTWTKTDI
jgi:hypothetical protein